jgi:cysteine desulfurase
VIYLDNSATTQINQEVYEAMLPYLAAEYGNPSSKYYALAVTARNAVEHARELVARLICAKAEEIVFTAGSTESTNMIIKGVVDYSKYYDNKGNHIITSTVEHKATLNTCKYLNGEIYSNKDATFSLAETGRKVDRGYKVTFLSVNEFGQVTPEVLGAAIRPTTILVSLIWGNNEIGTLNNVVALAKVCRASGVPFHVDATQVLGKLDINVHNTRFDYLSISAHKLYGPKGIGAAYICEDDYGLPPITALLHGGEQENGLRAGTLAVHNIVGFGKAAEIALRERETISRYYKDLDDRVVPVIKSIPHLRLMGDPINRLPGIYSVIVDKPEFNNERFIKKIAEEVALSTGSACAAGQPSHVLQAMGFGDFTSKVIRISVGTFMSESDITALISIIRDL